MARSQSTFSSDEKTSKCFKSMHAYFNRPYRNPLHCAVPPHILESIQRNAKTDKLRQIAQRALDEDEIHRNRRIVIAERVAGLRAFFRFQRQRLQDAGVPLDEGQVERTIYSADNSRKLPGRQVRKEGDPAVKGDGADAINEAYDGLGNTYDLYSKVYGRDSLDGAGLPLEATVHYGTNYDNAFWDGSQMVFGDGDGELFNRFTIAVDVIGHELTHGVTENESNLVYRRQSGALNESISDVFGSLIKQYPKTSADKADWLIGEGLFTDKVKSGKAGVPAALRSMKEPGTGYNDPVLGKDPQPATMSAYVRTRSDNGGVHINSGIPNHAFYLVATKIGGNAWEKAGVIWYNTCTSPLLNSNARFQDFAELTFSVAQELYGTSGTEQSAVRDGWSAVGIKV